MCFLGIDAGTTQIKAALIDFDGNQIDMVSAPVKILSPFEGACEIDMMGLWETFCKLTKELGKRNAQVWNSLAGIGITGQGDGLWAVDKKWKEQLKWKALKMKKAL